MAVLVFAVSSLNAHTHAEEPRGGRGSVRDLVEKVKPSVVGVDAYQTIPEGLWVHTRDFINPFPLRTFIGDTLSFLFYIPRAILYPFSSHRTGSGFITDAEGHVITNYHVIEDYNVFTVRLFDGSVHEAEVVGKDKMGDIALLKIDISKLGDAVYPVEIGDSDEVKPGDWVMVIGDPLGLKHTVTTGVVSGVGRRVGVTDLDDMIQVEASLDAGNSGGPVFNSDGKVIAIAAAQIFLAENKGFAIPINMATSVLDDLKTVGYPRRSRIGVIVEDTTVLFASSRGLPKPTGALIVSIERNSPAQQAGLRPGDLVLEYDGKKITNSLDLVRFVRRTTPGDEVTARVLPAKRTAEPTRPEEAEGGIKVFKIQPDMIKRGFSVF